MKINTKASGISLTPDITSYLDKKLAMFDKFLAGHEEAMIDVELARASRHHKAGDIFKAEFTLYTKGTTMRAVAEASDIYAAIDQAKDDLHRDLANRKDKKQSAFRRGALRVKNMLKGLTGRGGNPRNS